MSNQDTLYHVTYARRLPRILKQGILPDRKAVQLNILGRAQRKAGGVYAFEDYEDAVKWAHRMGWDWKDAVSIIAFSDDKSRYAQDRHIESQMGQKGRWLIKYGRIPPESIKGIIPMTPDWMHNEIAPKLVDEKRIVAPTEFVRYSSSKHKAAVKQGRKEMDEGVAKMRGGTWRRQIAKPRAGRVR